MIIYDLPDKHGGNPSAEAYSGVALAQAKAETVDPLAGAEQLPETFFTPQESEDLFLAATKMAEYVKGTSKVVYLMLAGGPLIVSATITVEQAVKNFEAYKVNKIREDLGVRWTEAEAKYTTLEAQINALSGEARQRIFDALKRQHHGRMFSSAHSDFLDRPTLDLAIELAREFIGRDAAESLSKFVDEITALLPQPQSAQGE